jgi:ATP-dependent Clp protease ATP-binding subunit ClpA
MRLQSAEPRIFGVVPPAVALALGIGAFVIGIVVLASAAILAGVIWLAAGVALLALALDASRRWPASALPRLAVRLVDAAGRRLGLVRATAGAWGAASRRVVALRRELRQLQGERDAQLLALGEAAYREDADETQSLKERIGAIDARIAADEREMEEVVSKARERVRKEKVAVRLTKQFAVAERPPPIGSEDQTRTAPTARRPASPRSV